VDKEVDKERSSTDRACITRLIAVESLLKQGCQGGGFPQGSNFQVVLGLLFSSPTLKTHQKNSALRQLGHRTD